LTPASQLALVRHTAVCHMASLIYSLNVHWAYASSFFLKLETLDRTHNMLLEPESIDATWYIKCKIRMACWVVALLNYSYDY
jgi:hypothetical protein